MVTLVRSKDGQAKAFECATAICNLPQNQEQMLVCNLLVANNDGDQTVDVSKQVCITIVCDIAKVKIVHPKLVRMTSSETHRRADETVTVPPR